MITDFSIFFALLFALVILLFSVRLALTLYQTK